MSRHRCPITSLAAHREAEEEELMNAGAGISASCRRFGRNLTQVSLTSGWRRHKHRTQVCETDVSTIPQHWSHSSPSPQLKGSDQKCEALSTNELMCSSQHTAGRPLWPGSCKLGRGLLGSSTHPPWPAVISAAALRPTPPVTHPAEGHQSTCTQEGAGRRATGRPKQRHTYICKRFQRHEYFERMIEWSW